MQEFNALRAMVAQLVSVAWNRLSERNAEHSKLARLRKLTRGEINVLKKFVDQRTRSLYLERYDHVMALEHAGVLIKIAEDYSTDSYVVDEWVWEKLTTIPELLDRNHDP